MKQSILIIDDEPAARYGLRRALEKEGYDIFEAATIGQAEQMIANAAPGLVLLDVKLASESGLDYLPDLVARNNAPVVIVVTAHGSEKLAVEAIKKGAYDYLPKPFEVEDLRIMVKNAMQSQQLRRENEQLRRELRGVETFGQLIGSSQTMAEVYSVIEKVAQTNITVVITGESGTGKELVAKEIHARSRAKTGAFIAMNCAAVPGDLIESELFGHEKGAFTGATGKRVGKFEGADKGTLFLDEIGDMSLSTQAKVLRVLEDKTFQRLGSNETLSSDARIISATNKDLAVEVEQKRFREDLYYRLSVVTIKVPPLRERKADIPALAQAFCERFSLACRKDSMRLSGSVIEALLEYHWPGNIRQLRNCIERAVVLTEGLEITPETLPQEISGKKKQQSDLMESSEVITVLAALDFKDAKRDFERKYVEKCLEQTGGNITKAAAILGIHRQSLQHKIRELGLTKKFILEE
jgi:DNA-binding NtrC family response regulator